MYSAAAESSGSTTDAGTPAAATYEIARNSGRRFVRTYQIPHRKFRKE
jgi:hypothetical protein